MQITCNQDLVSPNLAGTSEVGVIWTFNTIEQAESSLGWFFVHNCCLITEE